MHLVSSIISMRPLRLRRKKTVVTILVGLICKDGIALASDSQTTVGTSKRTDTDKIALVRYSNDGLAAVAQGGDYSLSSYAIDIFHRLALASSLDDYRKRAD